MRVLKDFLCNEKLRKRIRYCSERWSDIVAVWGRWSDIVAVRLTDTISVEIMLGRIISIIVLSLSSLVE